jgi:hypothetical protein
VSLSVIFLLDFGTVPTVWYILFFTLLGKRFKTLTDKKKKKEKNYFKSARFSFDQTKMLPFFSSYRFTTDYRLKAKCGVVISVIIQFNNLC